MFAISNFFEVQGSTEPYYVYRYLARHHQVSAFIPSNNMSSQAGVTLISRFPGMPTFMSYNMGILLTLLRKAVRSVDLIYTYKGVITPVLILKFFLRKRWVCDFRTSPVAQDIEFRQIKRAFSPFRQLSYFLGRKFYRTALRYCDLVVAISDEVKQELVDDYGVSAAKIHVQPLGVDLDVFKPQGEVPDPQEEFRMIYIGSIDSQRGLDIVIEALKELYGNVPIKFLLVGKGPQNAINALEDLARELGVRDCIEWKGFVSHEQIPRILDTCHVALSPLPALQAYEVSSPSKVFEYLAMQKVVVASDILAHRKIIEHGRNGLLVHPGDPQALAEVLRAIYYDGELRSRLMVNARVSVQSHSWDVLLPELGRRIQELAV